MAFIVLRISALQDALKTLNLSVIIDEEKYYFLFINNGDGWNVISEDSIKLEKLLKDKNIVFTGEYLLTVN